MLIWIVTALVVYLLMIFLPGLLYIPTEGVMTHVGSRDTLPEEGKIVRRARRALVNTQENMPIFLTLAVLALVIETVDMEQAILGAKIFVFGRVAYTISYLISIPWTRSAAYSVALLGCGLMLFALF